MSAEPILIGVSGQIASGKSTLVGGLAFKLGLTPVLERDTANPYLERFYRDPERWALHNFLFFFEQSLTDQLAAAERGAGIVHERLPQEHLEVFGREFYAHGFLSDDDIALLERLWMLTGRLLRPPDLLIHLEVTPDRALARLRERRHAGDDQITRRYLDELGRRYDRFADSWRASPVLRIDTQGLDVRSAPAVDRIARDVLDLLPAAESLSGAR